MIRGVPPCLAVVGRRPMLATPCLLRGVWFVVRGRLGRKRDGVAEEGRVGPFALRLFSRELPQGFVWLALTFGRCGRHDELLQRSNGPRMLMIYPRQTDTGWLSDRRREKNLTRLNIPPCSVITLVSLTGDLQSGEMVGGCCC